MPGKMTDFMEEAYLGKCPKCGRKLLLPAGKPNAATLFIHFAPDLKDLEESYQPWTFNHNKVLYKELQLQGLDVSYVKLQYMWLHQQTAECDQNWHFDFLLQSIAYQKPLGVMIMGAEANNFFFEKQVSTITGLQVESKWLPDVPIVMSMVSPGLALNDTVGEVRFALKNFVAAMLPKIGSQTLFGG